MTEADSMRVLVLCPHFEPDTAPTGTVMTEIVHQLVAQGHQVDVVTSLPWYEHHAVREAWKGRLWRRAQTEWGSVTRVHPFPTDKTNIPARALGFAGFTGLVGLLALFRRRRPDVVLTMSPPLTLGLPGWVVARVRRAPFVFNVQDIFPDVAIEVGAITNTKVIAVLKWLERFVYRRADAVTVLSSDLAENVEAKVGSKTLVRVIPNFVDTERIKPADRATEYRREVDAGDRVIVLYAGNLGYSQPLDLVIETARRWHGQRDDVYFVINGGGSERPRLEALADGLETVRFVDFQPTERLPEVLASGDIHLIVLKEGLARSSVPSKLYSTLAAGRPVLASIDPGTEISRVLDEHDCGVAVPPGNVDAFASALAALLDDAAARHAMGERGRAFVETWVSPAGVAMAYGQLFAELTSEKGSDSASVASRG
ncbi:MAG: glycosyltransferase family 4 protein [Actinomycetota bacterium]